MFGYPISLKYFSISFRISVWIFRVRFGYGFGYRVKCSGLMGLKSNRSYLGNKDDRKKKTNVNHLVDNTSRQLPHVFIFEITTLFLDNEDLRSFNLVSSQFSQSNVLFFFHKRTSLRKTMRRV